MNASITPRLQVEPAQEMTEAVSLSVYNGEQLTTPACIGMDLGAAGDGVPRPPAPSLISLLFSETAAAVAGIARRLFPFLKA